MGLFDFFSRKKKNTPAAPETNEPDMTLLEKTEVLPGLLLPKAFALHWSELEKTRLSCIAITAAPAADLALEQSKLGHYPCMPAGFDYPRDAEGRYMYPLAQINCKELPPLPGYPTSGYLQFYISGFDDVYGIDFENPQSQKNFRVLYFEEEQVEQYKTDFSFLDSVLESAEVPVNKPHVLSFATKDDYVGPGDVRADKHDFTIARIVMSYPSIEDELEEAAYDCFQPGGHKIGGYAGFTQDDPRIGNEAIENYILLFQLDSGDEIMWGDSGIANFFIHPDDLARKDFSKVLYNWDCC
ncbi:MAG: DUF1963 domain-containing protein [Chitinophagaceae bacterium]